MKRLRPREERRRDLPPKIYRWRQSISI